MRKRKDGLKVYRLRGRTQGRNEARAARSNFGAVIRAPT